MNFYQIALIMIFLFISLLPWYRLPTAAVSRWMRLPGRSILRQIMEKLLASVLLGIYAMKLALPLLCPLILVIITIYPASYGYGSLIVFGIPIISLILKLVFDNQSPYKKFDTEVKLPLQKWAGFHDIKRNIEIPTIYTTPLLCDVYQPKEQTPRSGKAIIHMHATAWQGMDKGQLTNHLFHRLVDQGHVIIDVAYTLAPTARMAQMVDEVKHVIAWVKENIEEYQIGPDKIILMGESGGGHLALLCAYTPNNPEFQSPSITTDTSVAGVIAIHAPTDLAIAYKEFGEMEPLQPETSEEITDDMQALIFNKTFLDRLITRMKLLPEYRYQNMPGGPLLNVNLMGGTLKEIPDVYAKFSPITHVTPDCPPMLYLTGAQDFYYQAPYGKLLHEKLKEADVSTVYHSFKLGDHGFLLFFSRTSQIAKTSMYTIAQWLKDLGS